MYIMLDPVASSGGSLDIVNWAKSTWLLFVVLVC